MYIVVLCFFVQLSICFPAVDHAASHGDRGGQDMVQQFALSFGGIWLCILHSSYATY